MQIIPKIFHQVWLGPNSLPKEFEDYQKTWKKFHPEWELMFWTEENLPPDLQRKEIYELLRSPVERSDLLRLEVLNMYGGIYMDTDFECLRSVEPLLDGVDLFLAYLEENRRTNNAIIGAVPGHPFIGMAIKKAEPRQFFGYDKAAAGPFFVDSLVKNEPDIMIFESYLFYPVTPLERERAIAIHHASRTWRVEDGFRASAINAERRLFAAQQKLMEVDSALLEMQSLNNIVEIHKRIHKVRSSISNYISAPTKADIGNPLTRMARKNLRLVRSFFRLVKGLFIKRVARRLLRVYNMRFRFTYLQRLDRIPDREELPILLNKRNLHGIGAEIGVKKGLFSEYLLNNWDCAKLISIDPWLEDAPEDYVDKANVPQDQQEIFYNETVQRLSKFINNSLIWRMTSSEAAMKIDDYSLDFVYIDARHDYDSVMEDLSNWYHKVKPGGIIAGHDYVDGIFGGGVFGVKRAVDEFFLERDLRVYSTEGKFPVEIFPSWIVEIPQV